MWVRFLECAGAWLVVDSAETMFHNFLVSAMPEYSKALVSRGVMRQYTSNAPSFVNALACTMVSLWDIYRGAWSNPLFPVVYFAYDALRGIDRNMRIHHLVGGVLLVMSGYLPSEVSATAGPWLLLSELSTCFLCIACVIKGHNKRPRINVTPFERTVLAKARAAFILSFGLTRMLLQPLVLLFLMNAGSLAAPPVMVLQAFNSYWFYLLLKKYT